MATPESIAIRRADALDRANIAIDFIAQQTGAKIEAYPPDHKRPEVRPAVEAEWLADALEAIASAIGGKPGATDDDGGSNLDDLTRAELNAYADKLGIEQPAKFPNKTALVEAIEAAVTAAFTEPDVEDEAAAGDSGDAESEEGA